MFELNTYLLHIYDLQLIIIYFFIYPVFSLKRGVILFLLFSVHRK